MPANVPKSSNRGGSIILDDGDDGERYGAWSEAFALLQ